MFHLVRKECGTSRVQRGRSYVALLLGETGSGKSTLINYLTNFFRNGTLTEPRIVVPNQYYAITEGMSHSEKYLGDQTKSKTANCQKYQFAFESNDYWFIDSPGLSDTSGVEQDDRNISQILAMAEQCGMLSAVVLVINGTVARATVNLRNTLTRLRCNLPDLLLDNLIIVLTNCTPTSYNFDFKSFQPWKLKPENVFIMDNSALSRDPSGWKNDSRITRVMEETWLASMDEIEKMIYRISDLDEKSTGVFKDLRTNRDKMKEELHAILLEIKKLQQTHDELQMAQSCYETATNDIQKYSRFKRSKVVEYIILVEAEYYSTICMIHTQQVCHDRCGLPETVQVNSDVFKRCACMSGSSCATCGCGHETHYHARKTLGKRTETVEEILRDIKHRFDTSSARARVSQTKVAKLGDDLAVLEKTLQEKQGKIGSCCRELQRICSAFNFVDEMYSVLDTMEANARTLTSLKAREEADRMFKTIKELVERLHAGSRNEGQDSDDHYREFDNGLARTRGRILRLHRGFGPATRNSLGSQRSAFSERDPVYNDRFVYNTEDEERGIRSDRSSFSIQARYGCDTVPETLSADRITGLRSARALLEPRPSYQTSESFVRRDVLMNACRYHNSTGCRMLATNCKFPHLCGCCGNANHTALQCPGVGKLPAANAVQTLFPGACKYHNRVTGCRMRDCKFNHVCGYCAMGNHTALQCQSKLNASVTAVAPQKHVPGWIAKNTPCKYYNQATGCRNASCGFSHKCSECGKSNHGASICRRFVQGPQLVSCSRKPNHPGHC